VRRRAAAVVVLLALVVPGAAHAYDRVGEYQTMGDAPRDWASPYPLPGGVPMVDYGTFEARNPVTSAQYGLASWSLWRRYGERPRLRAALRVADWLVRTQRPSGKWVYRFDYASPGTTMALPAPWGSALAQGQGISLLRRAYHRTGRKRYLRAAKRALGPLRRPVERGGLSVRRAEGLMFEEYPSERPSLPLNGHMQTLLGLYELSDVSPVARRLFARGADTLVRVLPQYDAGNGWSLYNLVHQSGFAPVPAQPDYHAAHVRLLRLIDGLWPHRVLRGWADAWAPAAGLRQLDQAVQNPPGDRARIMLRAHELTALGADPRERATVRDQRP
jgi:hypothetical protein